MRQASHHATPSGEVCPDVAAVAGAQRNRRQAVIDLVAPMNAIGSAQPNKP
jgi:hypothetical protein